ncbi:UNVERIFIED_CONTAM: hypothetical protein Slati_3897600 [Sesamum latifolium]|uniref:Uncharacterized protein n=1 Tax=Sesamum latifolium TaxID=2727402 RepID=A0AAW2TML0_9LAMI
MPIGAQPPLGRGRGRGCGCTRRCSLPNPPFAVCADAPPPLGPASMPIGQQTRTQLLPSTTVVVLFCGLQA